MYSAPNWKFLHVKDKDDEFAGISWANIVVCKENLSRNVILDEIWNEDEWYASDMISVKNWIELNHFHRGKDKIIFHAWIWSKHIAVWALNERHV